MGHREELLAGAKRCLYERGYARTTARDIVAESGTNLASIGYHFGSKDALLNAAMMEAFTEWGEELDQTLPIDPGTDHVDELDLTWTTITESFTSHRPLWVASIEAYAQAQHSEELREQLAASLDRIRAGLVGDISQAGADIDSDTARAMGSVQLALLTGLMMQWLIDPKATPTGHEVAAALRAITATPEPTPEA